MSAWRTVTRGLRTLFRRDDVERDLDDELQHYLEMATRENVRRGMSPDDAERAARVQMGGGRFEAAKETVRSGGWEASVASLRQELRVAARGLRRSPGFTFVAVISLALGIGATTTMFSVMNAVMFRPLPYHEPDDLALVFSNDTRRGLPRERSAYLTVKDWQARSRSFSAIAYYSTERVAPMHNDPSRGRGRSRIGLVSENFFAVLGTAPAIGRAISSLDVTDRAPVAVITHAFWQRWFAGAPDVVGKTFMMDDPGKGGLAPLTVIGVMPPAFYFPDRATEIFTPATRYWRFDRESVERFPGWARRWTGVGRLAPGASLDAARAELASIGRQLDAANPSTVPDFPGFATTVLPVLESIARTGLRASLWMLLATVALVLLVVCANVANLILARGATRQREFAVRRALGAGRGRLVRELFAESALLVIVGGAVGVLIAAWGTPLLASAAAAYLPRMDEIALDGRVLAFAAAATIVAGLAFGLVPALRLSATDANEALREGGRGTGNMRVRRSQGALVLAESALALVLLMGAGLLLKSLDRLNSVDPGFDPRNVLTMRLEYPASAPPTPAERTMTSASGQARARAYKQQMEQMLARLASLPGVEHVGVVDDMFIAGQGNESITIPGRSADQIPPGELAETFVSPGFFPVMRVPLRRGRYPTADDAEQKIRALFSLVNTDLSLADKERLATPEPVVVNEAFVRRFFPNDDPIGKKFCIDPTNKTYWYEIVGVVGDMRRSGLERGVIPQYIAQYLPLPNSRADLLIRTTRDPLALAATVRAEVVRAIPGVVVVSTSTAEAGLDGFSAQRRFQTWMITMFALLAVGLAAVGIFGLAHYAVAERRREIGVRVALGASPRDVLRLMVAQGMRMPALGIAIGIALSLGMARVIANQLYSVDPTDPVTFVAVAGVLTLVAATACWLAARRAADADPVQALRED